MATRQARRHAAPAEQADAPRAKRRSKSPRPPRAAATRRQRLRRRYAVVYDIDGPRVRLGLLWFLVAAAALFLGPLPAALVYGGAAAVAGLQTARVWRRKQRPHRIVAGATAGGMALAASIGPAGAGVAVLAGAAAAVIVAAGDAKSRNPTVVDAGWTIQCWLPVGLAATSMVLLTRLDRPSAVALLLLVSAYETGDYLIGSGARNPYEGPLAGAAAIVVVTFIVSTLSLTAFELGQAWVFGAAIAVLAPLGQLLASAVLPAAGAPASGLRRLDSLLLAAPVWYLGVSAVA